MKRRSVLQKQIVEQVSSYYTDKLSQHGTNARGVDWNGEESQKIRFRQLTKILEPEAPCRLLDLGCGYGALLDYLLETHKAKLDFTGVDISAAMLEKARERHHDSTWISKTCDLSEGSFDFVIASGIFSVKLGFEESQWSQYMFETLDEMNRLAVKGFAFNCLTWYSDQERKREDLYYPRPEMLFQTCRTKYSRNVALLHDYDLYEFTILVRKML